MTGQHGKIQIQESDYVTFLKWTFFFILSCRGEMGLKPQPQRGVRLLSSLVSVYNYSEFQIYRIQIGKLIHTQFTRIKTAEVDWVRSS